jgi:hypothetical protein
MPNFRRCVVDIMISTMMVTSALFLTTLNMVGIVSSYQMPMPISEFRHNLCTNLWPAENIKVYISIPTVNETLCPSFNKQLIEQRLKEPFQSYSIFNGIE